jgi:hypothetical protein
MIVGEGGRWPAPSHTANRLWPGISSPSATIRPFWLDREISRRLAPGCQRLHTGSSAEQAIPAVFGSHPFNDHPVVAIN